MVSRIRWLEGEEGLGDEAVRYDLMFKWTTLQPLDVVETRRRAELWIEHELALVQHLLKLSFQERVVGTGPRFMPIHFTVYQGTYIIFDIPVVPEVWPLLILHLSENQTDHLSTNNPQTSKEKLREALSSLEGARKELKEEEAKYQADISMQRHKISNFKNKSRLFSTDDQLTALEAELGRIANAWTAKKAIINEDIKELETEVHKIETALKIELDLDALSYEKAFLFTSEQWEEYMGRRANVHHGFLEKGNNGLIRATIERGEKIHLDREVSRISLRRSLFDKSVVTLGELPAYMSCMATVMKPPYPQGGTTHFGVMDFSNSERMRWPDILSMFREGAPRLGVEEEAGGDNTGDEIVLCREHYNSRILSIVRYMNRFMVHMVEGKPMVGIKQFQGQPVLDFKDANSIKQQFAHMKSRYYSPEMKKFVAVDFIKVWLDHEKRNQSSKLYYRPWPAHWAQQGFPVYGNEDEPPINSFPGYAHSMKDLARAYVKADKKLLKDQWDVMFNNLANCDPDVFTYMCRYYAHAVQFPYVRMLVSMVLSGASGIGKGTLNQIIKEFLGSNFHQIQDAEVTREFNARIAEKLIVFYDELRIKSNHEYSQLKTLITERSVDKNVKFVESKPMENYAHVLVNLNTGNLFSEKADGKMDADDRRFFMPSCPVQTSAENKKKADEVGSALFADKDQTVIKAFMFQLMMMNVLDFQFKKFPLTSRTKENRMFNGLGFVVEWMRTSLARGYIIDSPVQEFLRQTNNNNYAGTEFPRFDGGGEGGEGNRRPQQLKDTSFNPMKYEGMQLVKWNEWYGKRWHLTQIEWFKIKQVMGKGDAEEDDVSLDNFSCTPVAEVVLNDFWSRPDAFWMRLIPLEKLFYSFTFYAGHKYKSKNVEVNYRDFLTYLQVCFPCYTKKTLVITDPDSGVTIKQEFVFVPDLNLCKEYFVRQHPSLQTDTDVIQWTAPDRFMPAPRLDVLTNHTESIVDMLASKELQCQYVHMFKDQVEKASRRSYKRMFDILHADLEDRSEASESLGVLTYTEMRHEMDDLRRELRSMKRKLDEKEAELVQLRQEMADRLEKTPKLLEIPEKPNQEETWDPMLQAGADDLMEDPAITAALRDLSEESLMMADLSGTVEVNG